MFRPITIAAVLGVILCTVGAANAATYCAKYIGGHERIHSGARSQCEFSTLSECRARVSPNWNRMQRCGIGGEGETGAFKCLTPST